MNNDFVIEDNGLYNDYNYLYDVISYTLEHEKVNNSIFSIIFVDDDEIHKINRNYRNVDRITDVISFAFEDSEDLRYNVVRTLGDIYVCIPLWSFC